MKKLKLKKLVFNKKIVVNLTSIEATRIIGGDAPTYGQYCTVDQCNPDTHLTDDYCNSYDQQGTCQTTPMSEAYECFTDQHCTHGECTGGCPYTYGDNSCGCV